MVNIRLKHRNSEILRRSPRIEDLLLARPEARDFVAATVTLARDKRLRGDGLADGQDETDGCELHCEFSL